MSAFNIPLFIRGQVIEQDWVQFGGRGASAPFSAPDPLKYVDQLPLASPIALQDLQAVPFEEILDVLVELGQALAFDKNPYIQQAYAASMEAAPYPESMLKGSYIGLPFYFGRDVIREIAA